MNIRKIEMPNIKRLTLRRPEPKARNTRYVRYGLVVAVVLVVAVLFGTSSYAGGFSDLTGRIGLNLPNLPNIGLSNVAKGPSEEVPAGDGGPVPCTDKCGLGNIGVRTLEDAPATPVSKAEDIASGLVSTSPEHGYVGGAPGSITATFSYSLAAGSYIKIFKDTNNYQVDRGYTSIDGNTMETGLADSSAGIYLAEYKAVNSAGEADEGQFSFTIS